MVGFADGRESDILPSLLTARPIPTSLASGASCIRSHPGICFLRTAYRGQETSLKP